MQIKLLVEGGAMQPGPALSQKIGPLGLNIGQIISKVNDATKDFKGLKVPVELDVDTSTKEIKVNVFSPPVSELLKKELEITKGSSIQSKVQVANVSIEQIISVAKNKLPDLLCKDLKSAVKTIIGSCGSLGILIENKFALEIEQEITETPEEKKIELDKYFSEISEEQKEIIKQEEAEKEAKKK